MAELVKSPSSSGVSSDSDSDKSREEIDENGERTLIESALGLPLCENVSAAFKDFSKKFNDVDLNVIKPNCSKNADIQEDLLRKLACLVSLRLKWRKLSLSQRLQFKSAEEEEINDTPFIHGTSPVDPDCLPCLFCIDPFERYESMRSLHEHITSYHPGIHLYTCHCCYLTLTDEESFLEHVKSHQLSQEPVIKHCCELLICGECGLQLSFYSDSKDFAKQYSLLTVNHTHHELSMVYIHSTVQLDKIVKLSFPKDIIPDIKPFSNNITIQNNEEREEINVMDRMEKMQLLKNVTSKFPDKSITILSENGVRERIRAVKHEGAVNGILLHLRENTFEDDVDGRGLCTDLYQCPLCHSIDHDEVRFSDHIEKCLPTLKLPLNKFLIYSSNQPSNCGITCRTCRKKCCSLLGYQIHSIQHSQNAAVYLHDYTADTMFLKHMERISKTVFDADLEEMINKVETKAITPDREEKPEAPEPAEEPPRFTFRTRTNSRVVSRVSLPERSPSPPSEQVQTRRSLRKPAVSLPTPPVQASKTIELKRKRAATSDEKSTDKGARGTPEEAKGNKKSLDDAKDVRGAKKSSVDLRGTKADKDSEVNSNLITMDPSPLRPLHLRHPLQKIPESQEPESQSSQSSQEVIILSDDDSQNGELLDRHKDKHYDCLLCGIEVKGSLLLFYHMQEHDEKLAYCPICAVQMTPTSLNNSLSFFDHLISAHFTKNPENIKCPSCPTEFGPVDEKESILNAINHILYKCERSKVCMLCSSKNGQTKRMIESHGLHCQREHTHIYNRFFCGHCMKGMATTMDYAEHECTSISFRCSCDLWKEYPNDAAHYEHIMQQNDASHVMVNQTAKPELKALTQQKQLSMSAEFSEEHGCRLPTQVQFDTFFYKYNFLTKSEEMVVNMEEPRSPSIEVVYEKQADDSQNEEEMKRPQSQEKKKRGGNRKKKLPPPVEDEPDLRKRKYTKSELMKLMKSWPKEEESKGVSVKETAESLGVFDEDVINCVDEMVATMSDDITSQVTSFDRVGKIRIHIKPHPQISQIMREFAPPRKAPPKEKPIPKTISHLRCFYRDKENPKDTKCDELYGSPEELHDHFKSHHSMQNKHPCPMDCDVWFCPICMTLCTSINDYENHLKGHKSELYWCPRCPLLCRSDADHIVHKHFHDQGKIVFVCHDHEYSFTDACQYYIHLETHGIKVLKFCKLCGYANTSVAHVIGHINKCMTKRFKFGDPCSNKFSVVGFVPASSAFIRRIRNDFITKTAVKNIKFVKPGCDHSFAMFSQSGPHITCPSCFCPISDLEWCKRFTPDASALTMKYLDCVTGVGDTGEVTFDGMEVSLVPRDPHEIKAGLVVKHRVSSEPKSANTSQSQDDFDLEMIHLPARNILKASRKEKKANPAPNVNELRYKMLPVAQVPPNRTVIVSQPSPSMPIQFPPNLPNIPRVAPRMVFSRAAPMPLQYPYMPRMPVPVPTGQYIPAPFSAGMRPIRPYQYHTPPSIIRRPPNMPNPYQQQPKLPQNFPPQQQWRMDME